MGEVLTVCCLKTGTKYGAEYVNRLAHAVALNLPGLYDFVVVTDDHRGIERTDAIDRIIAPTEPILPGWWHKMQFFHPDGAFGEIKGRVLFLDLDVIITGPLDDLVNYPSDFVMMHDLQRPWRPASAVMLLEAGSRPWIWDAFSYNRKQIMRELPGDQDAIREIMEPMTRWGGNHYGDHCDFFPQAWIKSYKHHAVNGPPKDCRVVCFHGVPRPHEIKTGWTIEAWK